MSSALTTADLIRTRLLTAPAAGEAANSVDLTKVPVVVYQQTDLEDEVNRAVAKGAGAAVVIAWSGFDVPDPNTSTPRLGHRFTLGVFGRHKLATAAKPADGIVESIVTRLWQWVPAGIHTHCMVQITGCELSPDDLPDLQPLPHRPNIRLSTKQKALSTKHQALTTPDHGQARII